MSVSIRTGTSSYSFNNDDVEAADRHSYLSEILDEVTIARLDELGDLTGKWLLEIGAGGGSVARWMSNQVGPTGRVLATDINPRHIPRSPGVDILQHDLTTEPIPDGPWDAIHGRLVLLHLPEREEILVRLAEVLVPGGWLILEEWETSFRKMVLAAPDAESAALFDLYHELLVERILPAKGNSPSWASQAHSAMLKAGLTDVDTSVTARSWPGGTAGALLIRANIRQLRTEFLAAGMTAEQLDEICRLVTDPRVVVRSHFTYSTVGRRPFE